MENKEKKLKKRVYKGSFFQIMHVLFGVLAIGYTVFLVLTYNKNIFLGAPLSIMILFLYLWLTYKLVQPYSEGRFSTAKGVFYILVGFLLFFFLNFFVCATSFQLHSGL